MAISEETAALVAAQLAAAHCAKAPILGDKRSQRAQADFVVALHKAYKTYLETGTLEHISDAPLQSPAQDRPEQ
jgi:hypothetical protein